MGQLFKSSLAAGCLLWTVGCAGPAAAPGPALPVGARSPAPNTNPADKHFIIAPELAGILRVADVLRLYNPSGPYLKIQVNVQNLTASPQRFDYRIDWFDRDGANLSQIEQGFIPWKLLAHETSSIVVTAPTAMAVDFGIAFVPAIR